MSKRQMKHSKDTVLKLLENIRETHGSHDSYACFPRFFFLSVELGIVLRNKTLIFPQTLDLCTFFNIMLVKQ